MSRGGPLGRAVRGLVVFAGIVWAMLVTAGNARAAEDLAFAVLEHELPSRLCRGEGVTVSVVVRNDGALPWSEAAGDHLAYHWLDAEGVVVEREGRRTPIAATVLPGRTLQTRARVWAPTQPGRYILQWAMVREKVRWYPAPGDGHERVVVEVGEGSTPLAFSLEAEPAPTMVAGERAQLAVTLRNDGCAAWSARLGDALAYHWFDLDAREVVREGVRTPLPDVAPGESVAITADVEAPVAAGTHVLVFEMVREEVAWFGEPASGSAAATIEVTAPTLAWALLGADVPARGHAGASIDVRVRVRNDGTRAWSSAAGDRLSYRITAVDEPGAPARDGVRTPWPGDEVDPGDEVTLDATLELPEIPGRYTVSWRPVREDVRWLGPSTALSDAFTIEVGPPQLAWSVLEIGVGRRLWSSRTTVASVRVRNDGGDTWSAATGDRMSYRWHDADGEPIAGEGMRSELPHDVAPGEEATIDVRVRAPDQLGPAVLELGMVREHVAWFPPPPEPARARVRVLVLRWGLLVTAGGLCGLAVLGVFARLRPQGRVTAIVAHGWAPAHAAVACLGIGEIFADLAHIEAWSGVAAVSASASAWMALPLVLVPLRARTAAAVALISVAFALALVDLGYLDFFGSIVPSSALTAIHHLGDAHATVFSLWHPEYLQLAWPLAALFTLVGLVPPRPETAAPKLVVAAVLVVLATPAAWAIVELAASPIGARVFSERDNVGRLGLWNAHLFEVGRQFGRWLGVDALTPEQRREVDAWFVARRANDGVVAAHATRPNVVVIQVEAMQSWVVDAEIGGELVMPFLHGADAQALHFTHVVDQTAQGRTSDAEYLVLQSGHPLRTGALAFLRADNEFDTVAHRLADAGYATVSGHPYVRGFWNRAAIHPRYGFERSLFRDEIGPGPMVGWGLSDVEFLSRMAALLPTLREPFFGFFITLSLHHPYTEFPEHLAELELGELHGTALGNYLQGMRHADRALEAFFAGLRTAGLDGRTVVLVYGDHAAGLPRTPELAAISGVQRWDPTVPVRAHRVPALLWLPGGGRTGRDARVAGQVDLGPTVLDAAGVGAPPAFVGRSLLRPEGDGIAVLPDGSAIAEDRMWIARGRDGMSGGGCFERDGRSRTRSDCDALARRAADELWASRAVLDHDLYRAMIR